MPRPYGEIVILCYPENSVNMIGHDYESVELDEREMFWDLLPMGLGEATWFVKNNGVVLNFAKQCLLLIGFYRDEVGARIAVVVMG